MTCRKSKRHLEFEALEALELLSGIELAGPHTMILHHAAQVHRGTQESVGDVALNLSGTVPGTYSVVGRGPAASFKGRGTVSPIGRTQMQGSIALGGSAASGRLTLNFGRSGKVFAAITGQTPGGGYTYQITGGTRTFAGDTGSGVAFVQILPSNPARTRGHVTVNFQGASSS
jgi:hypothetical protein